MNALEIKNYLLYGERKREEFQQKIEGLLEKKEWHTIDRLIRFADADEAPLSKLREIILDVSKVAAEKMNPYDGSFDYINNLFRYWKGIAVVKKDKEIDSFIKTLEVAFKLDQIDNKKFYTPEMHFISDSIEKAGEEKINLAELITKYDLSYMTGTTIHMSLGTIFKYLASKRCKGGFTLRELYEKVNKYNKRVVSKYWGYGTNLEGLFEGYLSAFLINKLLKNELIRRD